MTSVMTATFHGNVLYGTHIGTVVYVALKPIVDAMGLEWSAQLKRIKREPVLAEGMAVMAIPTSKGEQETVTLKLDLVPGWLFTISTLRISNEQIRKKVILFKRECFSVLAEHFLGRRSTPTPELQSLGIRMAHEARLLFGKKAGAEVWVAQGLPKTPAMTDPLEQDDLFSWGQRQRKRRKNAA